jgi:hypothetical protein
VWQSFQFIRQDNTNLFLLAMDSPNALPSDGMPGVAALYRFPGTNHVYTYTNDGNISTNTQSIHLELVQRRTFKMSEPFMGDFDAVGAAYVSPSGELILYAGEHRDGPDSPGDTVRMGEWRSRSLYNARAQDPCNPWVQLYADVNNDGSSLAVEFHDYFMDDYDNLNEMRIAPGDADGWSNRARSLRWYAPVGTTIRLRNFGSGTSGGAHIDLVGDGTVQSISNLANKPWDNALGSANLASSGVEFMGEFTIHASSSLSVMTRSRHIPGNWFCGAARTR